MSEEESIEETIAWKTNVRFKRSRPQKRKRGNRDGILSLIPQEEEEEMTSEVEKGSLDETLVTVERYEVGADQKKLPTSKEFDVYKQNLKDLGGEHSCIPRVHSVNAEKKEVVLDRFGYSLEDKILSEDSSFFFSVKNISWRLGGKIQYYEFSPKFKETVKAIVEGIAMLYKKGKKYSYLSPSTIVFYENDKDLTTPIFVDLFDDAPDASNKNQIWLKLADFMESILSRFEIPNKSRPYLGKKMEKTPSFWGEPSSPMKQEEELPKKKFLKEQRDPDINGFLEQLRSMGNPKATSIPEKKILQHPAILQKEYVRAHVEQMKQIGFSQLPTTTDFTAHVCRQRPWKDVAITVPHLKVMLNRKGAVYNKDLQGLISLCRNTYVHLKENLLEASKNDQDIITTSGTWSSMDPKMYLLDDAEISKLFDETFPGFLSLLYRVTTNEQWVVVRR